LVQETKRITLPLVIASRDVTTDNFERNGAKKVKVRYLIDERHGSNRFALRLYSVEKGGETPLDQHAYEHQVYVLIGQGMLRQQEGNGFTLREIKAGDAIFIPSNAVHQFINERDEPLEFLCVKGNPELYVPNRARGTQRSGDDSDRNFC
jgi:quercetin dioxygenase-like cupin family protein